MINKQWFEENRSFCTFDEYERGKAIYIKECIKQRRKDDWEEFKADFKIFSYRTIFIICGGKIGKQRFDFNLMPKYEHRNN